MSTWWAQNTGRGLDGPNGAKAAISAVSAAVRSCLEALHSSWSGLSEAMARTARVITAAALIMVAVFGAFALSPEVFLKLIGVGLATAILVDATVVRMVLVPAVMQLLGEHNWWLPRWLDRVIPRMDLEAPAPAPAG